MMDIIKSLPGFSLLYFLKNSDKQYSLMSMRGEKPSFKSEIKGIGKMLVHVAYLMIGVGALVVAAENSLPYSLNPFLQVETQRERSAELNERLFGSEGLADTNHNGSIDLPELADAYCRMGLEQSVLNSRRFPEPSIEELERAVQSYESK